MPTVFCLHRINFVFKPFKWQQFLWESMQNWNKPYECRDSLLYKGSEDDDELGLEVTGWVWNKRTKTKTMMTATRMRVKGLIVAVRLRLWGVDKRTVWGLFAEFKRSYILNTGGPCALFRAGNTTGDGCNDTIYGSMSQVESYRVRDNSRAETAHLLCNES